MGSAGPCSYGGDMLQFMNPWRREKKKKKEEKRKKVPWFIKRFHFRVFFFATAIHKQHYFGRTLDKRLDYCTSLQSEQDPE